MQNDLKKWIKPKMRPFLAPNNLRAAAFLMLRARLRWQSKSQERLISHGRLAFCTATKILYLLAFISWAASSIDNVSRKSAIEEKMFWKVMLSSALIFFQQKIFARLTSLFLPLFAFETTWEVFLFKTVGHVIDRDIYSEIEHIRYFFPLAAWWSFRHAKLTAGGGAQARILAIEFVWFFSFFFSFLFLFPPTFSIFSLLPLPLPLLSQ